MNDEKQYALPLRNAKSRLIRGAMEITHRLRDHGYTTYWAGGAVRDMLLGNDPHDIDIATSAKPDQVQSLFRYTIPVGMQFGVILVRNKGLMYEVATFRGDGKYKDGRRPDSVYFTDPRKDALRRDFTVNGLFYDPVRECVIDYVNGIPDIERGLIRTIGSAEKRFNEDHLRILRAVRFASTLRFRIDNGTFDAVRSLRYRLSLISAERIREELIRMFSSPSPHISWKLLCSTGLREVIFRYIPDRPNSILSVLRMFAWLRRHAFADKLDHFFPTLGAETSRTTSDFIGEWTATKAYLSVFALLFYALYRSEARRIPEEKLHSLRMSNDEIHRISAICRCLLHIYESPANDIAEKKRWVRNDAFPPAFVLALCKALAKRETTNPIAPFIELYLHTTPEILFPPPLVTGKDLQKLGLSPGPVFRQILHDIETEQLKGSLENKSEAIEFIRRRFASDIGDISTTNGS